MRTTDRTPAVSARNVCPDHPPASGTRSERSSMPRTVPHVPARPDCRTGSRPVLRLPLLHRHSRGTTMLKLAVAAALAATPLALVDAPGASAAPGPTHTLLVSGTGVGMYPAYDGSVRRYAATTTEETFPGDATDNTTNQD